MKGTNNGQRRRYEKSAAINAFTMNILETGNAFKDRRGQVYTTKFIGGYSIEVDNPKYDADDAEMLDDMYEEPKRIKVWKGGGNTVVKGAVQTGESNGEA